MAPKSIFDAIISTESASAAQYECAKYANRVGLICKVLLNRGCDKL